jgi:hypothetical protein
VPNGLHVLDAAFWHGKLYVSTGTQAGAILYESADRGATWRKAGAANTEGRFYGILPLGDRLLVSAGDPEHAWTYDGTNFTRLAVPIAPATPRKNAQLYRLEAFGNAALYTLKQWRYSKEPAPLYCLDDFATGAVKIAAFRDKIVQDIVVRDGVCHVLTAAMTARKGAPPTFTAAIYSSRDLRAWTREAVVTLPALPGSLEVANGTYYLGLANHDAWASADTASGNIYRVP